jgi:SAM-dependent methyltransferase
MPKLTTPENKTLPEKWAVEYRMGGIPSSTRTTPSGTVLWAVRELKQQNYALHTAVDIGCGKGRNSLYLAEQGMHVTAMDFTPNAIRQLNEMAAEHGLTDEIRAIVHDVVEDWPVSPVSMDLAIDAFCFKHITPRDARIAYKDNLLRALRMRGHYLISFASIGDGYYGQYVVEHREENGEQIKIVIDPVNDIPSILFTREHVLQFFGPELDLLDELHNNKPSEMHGQIYQRSTYALLLKRNPHVAR